MSTFDKNSEASSVRQEIVEIEPIGVNLGSKYYESENKPRNLVEVVELQNNDFGEAQDMKEIKQAEKIPEVPKLKIIKAAKVTFKPAEEPKPQKHTKINDSNEKINPNKTNPAAIQAPKVKPVPHQVVIVKPVANQVIVVKPAANLQQSKKKEEENKNHNKKSDSKKKRIEDIQDAKDEKQENNKNLRINEENKLGNNFRPDFNGLKFQKVRIYPNRKMEPIVS